MQLECRFTQGFSQNANPLYHDGGLLGHTGIDESCGYGTDIHSYVNGYVYSLYPVAQPASDGYTAIFCIVETPLEVFEWSVGHVSRIDVVTGDVVKKGDLIGAEGNHGEVYDNGVHITLAMQAAGDHRGSHRHVQKRPVKKVRYTSPGKTYLRTERGIYYDAQGFYYEVYDYENGFNGCVDWTAPLFNRNLYPGCSGYDVYLLQNALVRLGFATYQPTGYYGVLTFASVLRYQKALKIQQVGVVGPQTRASLNTSFSQLA